MKGDYDLDLDEGDDNDVGDDEEILIDLNDN
jgi:hypothetical protein